MRTAPCNRIKENDVMNKKTEELEEIIGYHFKNKHLSYAGPDPQLLCQ